MLPLLAIAPCPHIRNAFSGIGLKSHRVKEIESVAEKESRMVSLRPDNVRIAAHALDKADAIHQAGAILVEGGYIPVTYTA